MQTDTLETAEEDLKPVWAITAAHIAVDFYMTLFPPLLAVFKLHFGLSLVQTSLLPAVVSVFGAVPQPFMGYLGDRGNRMALAAGGLLVCGIFISLIGLAPTAWILALLLFVSALGSSVFHPTAGGLVTAFAPKRPNLALSIFLTGGTLGMAISPITSTQIVERVGLPSLWLLAFPCVLISAALYWTSRLARSRPVVESGVKLSFAFLRTAEMRPLWTLYAISVLRSLIHAGYVGFTALLGAERGWTTGRIGWVLSGFLVCSTLGRLLGGYVADRASPRKLLALSSILSMPFFVAFAAGEGSAVVGLYFVAGFIFETGLSTNIVLAQQILPRNTSMATGLMMGFAWAVAGCLLPLVGLVSETYSVSFAMTCVSLLLIPAAALVALLPSGRSTRQTQSETDASTAESG